MKKLCAQLRIEGQVQGVSFRYHTRETARRLNLSGWVKNLPDGAVAAAFEGDEAGVRQMIDWCRQGPAAARVDKVDVSLADSCGQFSSFEIVF
ncbi:acylphosphatase [Geoalkalibacter ferrihydriticus]|uniref:Acylphosphatase n=2 Tax=Geoalkalibacter ferrihydriticus TaxID=392333 RepID=A0A0C2HT02_9BACT|nr:acylphosphatase [Geoalkalibacter ferrihydriticus]KIH77940.1 acylphosphatase [Geoalkalibacter ferrihydriticus DSM 17813]SDM36250.1 acylphosphatase [Geoalkalibacter ferrihydriticus]